jgi:Mrp family chromosome partitioning ATPase
MMVDLATEMAVLAERLGPPPGAVARVVQFVSPAAGAGASTVAREFARHVAGAARRGVWLVELDLMKGEQYEYFVENRETYGGIGEPARASPTEAMFFTVTPKVKGADGQPWSDVRYLAAHTVGRSPLWVTRFRREALKPGQTAQILCEPDYWAALRRHADYVVIDAPSADRSAAYQAAAPFVDANVLVISAADSNAAAATALRDNIAAVGGRCAGVVLSRARSEPPSFLKRMLP